MRKLFLLLPILLISNLGYSQTNLFEHPDFAEISKDHKIFAIVPFKTTISLRPKHMKDITAEQLAKMEEAEGKSIQHAMHSWFLKRKKRGSLSVDVQSPAKTNALLKKAGITAENYESHTPSEIAKILNVDSIIMGTFDTDKPMSEGASLALAAAFGFLARTNSATINLSVYNGADGELLVNYNKNIKGSLGSDNDDLVNTIMRKASRRIAYTKS